MRSLNISLPETLMSFVEEQVASRGYGTGSEYVRDLIRKDQERQKLRMLLDGAASAPSGRVDKAYFEGLACDRGAARSESESRREAA